MPSKFEVVGDVLMIPETSLMSKSWNDLITDKGVALWSSLAECFGLHRVGRKALIDDSRMRRSQVQLLYNNGSSDSWVTVIENHIAFNFDITR
jgi:tRNA G37 N-methylase Trm5